ncbi:MAG: HNH endonuclease [Clostridia bacterium]|nr:HNH endonuclease [Clostridia bacterium]
MEKLKLNFEIIPTGAWGFNLRTTLSKKAWDLIRKKAYEEANGKCSICNRPTKRLEAHERWDFNKETKTQKLLDVIAVCHSCHSVIHIGRTQLIGEEDKAIIHFKKVNKVDYSAYINALKEANEKSISLSDVYEWSLDLSYLKKYIEE